MEKKCFDGKINAEVDFQIKYDEEIILLIHIASGSVLTKNINISTIKSRKYSYLKYV